VLNFRRSLRCSCATSQKIRDFGVLFPFLVDKYAGNVKHYFKNSTFCKHMPAICISEAVFSNIRESVDQRVCFN